MRLLSPARPRGNTSSLVILPFLGSILIPSSSIVSAPRAVASEVSPNTTSLTPVAPSTVQTPAPYGCSTISPLIVLNLLNPSSRNSIAWARFFGIHVLKDPLSIIASISPVHLVVSWVLQIFILTMIVTLTASLSSGFSFSNYQRKKDFMLYSCSRYGDSGYPSYSGFSKNRKVTSHISS